jgi:putative Mg2+ transporter-C (MgtC) family protein
MLTWQETLFRLFISAVLCGLIGLDRGRRDLGAGLRTHMLVSVGSALLMLVSAYGFSRSLKPSLVVLDPSRVAAQVVSGIGFLGAGTMMLSARSKWAFGAFGQPLDGERSSQHRGCPLDKRNSILQRVNNSLGASLLWAALVTL